MTEERIQEMLREAGQYTAERMREYHIEDMKVMREYMDMRFDVMGTSVLTL